MLKSIQRRKQEYRQPQYGANQPTTLLEQIKSHPVGRALKRGIDKLWKVYVCLGPQLRVLGKRIKKNNELFLKQKPPGGAYGQHDVDYGYSHPRFKR